MIKCNISVLFRCFIRKLKLLTDYNHKMSRKKISEKEMIANHVNRRPYGAKLSLFLEPSTKFSMNGECSLLISPEIIIRLTLTDKTSIEQNTKQQQWDIYVEGFATAGEAEQAGLKVALGFLWAAVSGRYSARLIYNTPLPCSVYDRTQSNIGIRLSGGVSFTITKNINHIVDPINQIFTSEVRIDQKLLLATELFASARLETTERSKFVGLISSLEPLATQEKYEGEEIEKLIKKFKNDLKTSNLDDSLKNSLRGRIDQLKIESVSRAIRRMIQDTFPDDVDLLELIEDAYNLRSKILHEGSTDADLNEKSIAVEDAVRKIFEALILNYAEGNS